MGLAVGAVILTAAHSFGEKRSFDDLLNALASGSADEAVRRLHDSELSAEQGVALDALCATADHFAERDGEGPIEWARQFRLSTSTAYSDATDLTGPLESMAAYRLVAIPPLELDGPAVQRSANRLDDVLHLERTSPAARQRYAEFCSGR